MAQLDLHLPWDSLDLRHRGDEYRGLATCGRMVPPDSMGSFDGPHRVSCPDCRSDNTAVFAPRRASALREYLAKTRPQRPLDTAEIATLGLVPADQDVRVGGKWTTRALDELLSLSTARMGPRKRKANPAAAEGERPCQRCAEWPLHNGSTGCGGCGGTGWIKVRRRIAAG